MFLSLTAYEQHESQKRIQHRSLNDQQPHSLAGPMQSLEATVAVARHFSPQPIPDFISLTSEVTAPQTLLQFSWLLP